MNKPDVKKQSINIRDQFHFSVVHQRMNVMGPVQSSGVIYFAWDLLRSYFDEQQKNEIYFLNIYIATDFP